MVIFSNACLLISSCNTFCFCWAFCFFAVYVQLDDLAKVSIKGQVVQAAKMPTSNALRRVVGNEPQGGRSRSVFHLALDVLVGMCYFCWERWFWWRYRLGAFSLFVFIVTKVTPQVIYIHRAFLRMNCLTCPLLPPPYRLSHTLCMYAHGCCVEEKECEALLTREPTQRFSEKSCRIGPIACPAIWQKALIVL